MCRTLLRIFYDGVLASTVFYAVVCWGDGTTERDRKRLSKLVKRAGSVLDCPLEDIEDIEIECLYCHFTEDNEFRSTTPD